VIHESTEETERAVIFQEYQNIMSEAVRPKPGGFFLCLAPHRKPHQDRIASATMITHSKTKHRVPGVVCEGGVVLSPHECLQRLRHDQFNLSRRAGSSPLAKESDLAALIAPGRPQRQVREA